MRQKTLGIFTLTMINVALILSLRNLPTTAVYGWGSIFFYLVPALLFFLPAAFVSAELATGWPSRGGVYSWVKEAFGKRWGFVAIWMQWTENIVYYPTLLSFTAATLSYIVDPTLAENNYYIMAMIMIIYWGCTFINYYGMELSGFVSSFGVIGGTLLPGAFIILLALFWLFSGHPLQIASYSDAAIPDMTDLSNIVFLAGVVVGFCGIEVSSVHALEVQNPQKNYPKAIFLATAIILVLSVFGTLAISFVIPEKQINIVSGVMQTFSLFLQKYGLEWLTKPLALVTALGTIATVTSWIIGPSKGLFETAHDGLLPPLFHIKNSYGVPVTILLGQGIVVSLLTSAFLFMPTVSSSYWMLNALIAILYLVMYLLLFASAIKLRYSQPDVKRTYRIPGGKTWGMWLVAGTGFTASFFTLFISFIPPAQLDVGSTLFYELFLVAGLLIMLFLPLAIHALHKREWEVKAIANEPSK